MVLPSVSPLASWPSGWERVTLSGGRHALVLELPSRVVRAQAGFCRHSRAPAHGADSSSPACQRVDLSWPFDERQGYRSQDRGYGVLPADHLAPDGAVAIEFRFALRSDTEPGPAVEEVIVLEDKTRWEARIVSTEARPGVPRGRAVVLEQRPPDANYGRNLDPPGFVVVTPEVGAALRRADGRPFGMEEHQ